MLHTAFQRERSLAFSVRTWYKKQCSVGSPIFGWEKQMISSGPYFSFALWTFNSLFIIVVIIFNWAQIVSGIILVPFFEALFLKNKTKPNIRWDCFLKGSTSTTCHGAGGCGVDSTPRFWVQLQTGWWRTEPRRWKCRFGGRWQYRIST